MNDQTSNEHIADDLPVWTGLLAHWATVARAALALPEGPEGDRWRRATPPLLGLHALAAALDRFPWVPLEEWPLALDLAAVQIRQHAREIHELWAAEPMPEEVARLIDEARLAHDVASSLGLEARVVSAGFVMPPVERVCGPLVDAGFAGDVLIAPEGATLAAGSPAAFVRPPAEPPAIEGLEWSTVPTPPRQVYRSVDDAGDATDTVAPFLGVLLPGRPMLLHALRDGQRQPLPPASAQPRRVTLALYRDPEQTSTGPSAASGDATSTS